MKITKLAALAASALLVLAACSDEAEPAASDEASPAAIEAAAEPDDRVEQLQTQLDALDARLGDADLADIESRLSELESQVDLLSTAFEELQEPSSLVGSTNDVASSPEAPEATDSSDG